MALHIGSIAPDFEQLPADHSAPAMTHHLEKHARWRTRRRAPHAAHCTQAGATV